MRHIIIDTDLGMGLEGSQVDDGFALALACAEHELEIDLVTTVHGNIDVKSATQLTTALLKQLKRPSIPVVQGASTPLMQPQRNIASAQTLSSRRSQHAAEAIADLIMSRPGEVTVVGIGPLTNIAMAILLEPELATAVREIVVMGGKFLGQTLRTSPAGEFNVCADPEAAEIVLRSGAPMRWVGLDVTSRLLLGRDHLEQMASEPGSFSKMASAHASAWIDRMDAEYPRLDPSLSGRFALHDPLAIAVLVRPDIVTWQPAHVSVLTEAGVGRGMTITDLLQTAEPPTSNCSIATDIKEAQFFEYFAAAIGSLK